MLIKIKTINNYRFHVFYMILGKLYYILPLFYHILLFLEYKTQEKCMIFIYSLNLLPLNIYQTDIMYFYTIKLSKIFIFLIMKNYYFNVFFLHTLNKYIVNIGFIHADKILRYVFIHYNIYTYRINKKKSIQKFNLETVFC